MKNNAYGDQDSKQTEMGSAVDSTDTILNLKFSDLLSEEYNCFVCSFQDEKAFEEFKKDLRDLQKVSKDCCSNVLDTCDDTSRAIDLNELHFICRPNYVCKNRRGQARKGSKERLVKSIGRPQLRLPLLANVSSVPCSSSSASNEHPMRASSKQYSPSSSSSASNELPVPASSKHQLQSDALLHEQPLNHPLLSSCQQTEPGCLISEHRIPTCETKSKHQVPPCVAPSKHHTPTCVVPSKHHKPTCVTTSEHHTPTCLVTSEHHTPNCVTSLEHPTPSCVTSSQNHPPTCFPSPEPPTIGDKLPFTDNYKQSTRSEIYKESDIHLQITNTNNRPSNHLTNNGDSTETNPFANNILNGFLDNDENFREFERVLETVRNSPGSKDDHESSRQPSRRRISCSTNSVSEASYRTTDNNEIGRQSSRRSSSCSTNSISEASYRTTDINEMGRQSSRRRISCCSNSKSEVSDRITVNNESGRQSSRRRSFCCSICKSEVSDRTTDNNEIGRQSSRRRSSCSTNSNSEVSYRTTDNAHAYSDKLVGDTFSDFFDNDESFLEFEKEFHNFRSSRRSDIEEHAHSKDSSQDIFEYIRPYCDINLNSHLESHCNSSSGCLRKNAFCFGGNERSSCRLANDENCRGCLACNETRRYSLEFDEKRRCSTIRDEKRHCNPTCDEKRHSGSACDKKRRCSVKRDEIRRCSLACDEKRHCSVVCDEIRSSGLGDVKIPCRSRISNEIRRHSSIGHGVIHRRCLSCDRAHCGSLGVSSLGDFRKLFSNLRCFYLDNQNCENLRQHRMSVDGVSRIEHVTERPDVNNFLTDRSPDPRHDAAISACTDMYIDIGFKAVGVLEDSSLIPAVGELKDLCLISAVGVLEDPSLIPAVVGLNDPCFIPAVRGLEDRSLIPAAGGLEDPSLISATGGLEDSGLIPAVVELNDPCFIKTVCGLEDPCFVPAVCVLEDLKLISAAGRLDDPSLTKAVTKAVGRLDDPSLTKVVIKAVNGLEDPKFIPPVVGLEDPKFIPPVVGLEDPKLIPPVVGLKDPKFIPPVVGLEDPCLPHTRHTSKCDITHNCPLLLHTSIVTNDSINVDTSRIDFSTNTDYSQRDTSSLNKNKINVRSSDVIVKENDDALNDKTSVISCCRNIEVSSTNFVNKDIDVSLFDESSFLNTFKSNDASLDDSLSYQSVASDNNDETPCSNSSVCSGDDDDDDDDEDDGDLSIQENSPFNISNDVDNCYLYKSPLFIVNDNIEQNCPSSCNKYFCITDYIIDKSGDNHKINENRTSCVLYNDGRESPIFDHCSSLTCFCRSDLHIEEPFDEVFVDCNNYQSQSFIDCDNYQSFVDCDHHQNHSSRQLNNQSQIERFKQKISDDSFNFLFSFPGSNDPSHNSSAQSATHHSSGVGPLSRDFELGLCCCTTGEGQHSTLSPVASSEHSDLDSECYHTASSAWSGRYSTAKSQLSVFVSKEGSEFSDVCCNFDDFSEKSSPASEISGNIFDVSEFRTDQSVVRRQRHSFDGGRDKVQYKLYRPRSTFACNYTCHQHCISAVNLSCKTISGDGSEISRASSPNTPSPQPLFRNFNSRPGSAVIVASSAPRDRTASEANQNTQKISPSDVVGRNTNCHKEQSHGFVDKSKASNSPTNQFGSVKEDFFTAHIPQNTKCSVISSVQLTSSPQHQSHYSNINTNSQNHTDSTRQPQTAANISASFDGSKDIGGNSGDLAVSYSRSEGQSCIVELTKDNSTCLLDVSRVEDDSNLDAATEKDETDSGYRSGTIPDDKLPRVPSQTTLDQQELIRKVTKFNHFVPAVNLQVNGKDSFQGFLKVTMNLIRPITMELGARPPSIYELLTREHIIEENTQHVAFYMPRDTHKSLHVTSDTTTKEVISSLLNKFHILDHPRKFAMYEQEFNDKNKLVRLRRLTDRDCPLRAMVNWDPEKIRNYRMVLQENETGEIVWDAFSLPELNNFLRVLDREERETVIDLKHKYAFMKQYMERRLGELRGECGRSKSTT